jgi:hypothetical protein
MFRNNKKGAMGIIITTFILLLLWFFLFIMLDTFDFVGDKMINNTWEDSEDYDWYSTYGTYQDHRTNMKLILFPLGLFIIFIAGASAAYRQKVTEYRR